MASDEVVERAQFYLYERGYVYRPTYGEPLLSRVMADFAQLESKRAVREFIEKVRSRRNDDSFHSVKSAFKSMFNEDLGEL